MKPSNVFVCVCASAILMVTQITHIECDPSETHDDHEPAEEDVHQAEGGDPDDYDDVPQEVDEHHPQQHWAYHGTFSPANWSMLEKACDSANPRQSPIDINPIKTKYDDTLDEIRLVTSASSDDHVVIENNGHSVSATFDSKIHMEGGGLPSLFQVAGLHFHWGTTSKYGSEHTISDQHFPLEMHIVTYDSAKYDAVGNAVHGNNSLAVLGLIFEISDDDNPALDPIISSLEHIPYPENETTITNFDITTLLPDGPLQHYYRYLGSLTTPPCAESVIWTVLETKSTVSESQLAKFHLLLEDDHEGHFTNMTHNWRPTQPTHKRIVYRSFPLFKPDEILEEPEQGENKDKNDASSIHPFKMVTISLVLLATFWANIL